MADWKIILTDLDWVPLGEITALFEFTLTKPLNAADTCSFRVRYDNPLYEQLDSLECYVKVYRDNVLEFFGPVLTCETTGASEAASAAVTASGPSWVFDRLPVWSLSSMGSTVDRGAYFAAVAQASITNAWNSAYPAGGTWCVLPVWVPPVTLGLSYLVPYLAPGETKTLQSFLNEIAAGLDGFDWIIVPTEPTDNWSSSISTSPATTFPSIGTFTSQAEIGTTRPDVIFEYGMGQRSLAEFQSVTTREEQATRVHTNYTQEDGTTTREVYPDLALLPVGPAYQPSARKWGLLYGEVSLDIPEASTRQEVLEGVHALRKEPRRRLTITPRSYYPDESNPPAYRDDWNLGDTVGVRIAGATGEMRINASVRIFAVQFTLSDNGAEKIALTVVEQ